MTDDYEKHEADEVFVPASDYDDMGARIVAVRKLTKELLDLAEELLALVRKH